MYARRTYQAMVCAVVEGSAKPANGAEVLWHRIHLLLPPLAIG